MIQHVKFGSVTKLVLTATGAGIGTVLGILKASSIEEDVNRFIDTVNEITSTMKFLNVK